jgi:hypothetical protein
VSEHASLLALERHRFGETAGEIRAHIEGCDHCRERLRAMESDDRAFMIRHPTARSIGVRPRRRVDRIAPLIALAACAAGLLLLLPDPETTRMKGETHVELIVRRGAETFPFDRRPLRRGDTLLFKYTSTRRHMLLAGMEASGEVSIFVPDATLEPGQNRIAPQGLELDDYQGSERVILLLSDEPLDAAEVERALVTQARRDPLVSPRFEYDADQVSWLIEREPR